MYVMNTNIILRFWFFRNFKNKTAGGDMELFNINRNV